MSYPPDPNYPPDPHHSPDPYASPTTDSYLSDGKTIDAMRAFKVPFNSENWFVDILLATVCLFIPIVGPIVLLGYEIELIQGWLKRPGQPHEKLDFGRFMDYLKSGVWPFVAALIGQLIAVPLTMVFMIPFFCLFFGSSAFLGDSDTEAIGVLCMIFSFVLLFVGVILVNVLTMCFLTPMMVGAGLAGEVGPAVDFGYIKDFLAKTWKEMMKAYLLYMVVGMFLSMLGYCALFVGLYFVMAWMSISWAHLQFQAYSLYLARGGKPIQPKPQMAG